MLFSFIIAPQGTRRASDPRCCGATYSGTSSLLGGHLRSIPGVSKLYFRFSPASFSLTVPPSCMPGQDNEQPQQRQQSSFMDPQQVCQAFLCLRLSKHSLNVDGPFICIQPRTRIVYAADRQLAHSPRVLVMFQANTQEPRIGQHVQHDRWCLHTLPMVAASAGHAYSSINSADVHTAMFLTSCLMMADFKL